MKIVQLNEFKEVSYFGHAVHVPHTIQYIATDKSGKLYGFELEPVADQGLEFWDNPTGDDMYEIGHVDLEGKDWTSTLKSV